MRLRLLFLPMILTLMGAGCLMNVMPLAQRAPLEGPLPQVGVWRGRLFVYENQFRALRESLEVVITGATATVSFATHGTLLPTVLTYDAVPDTFLGRWDTDSCLAFTSYYNSDTLRFVGWSGWPQFPDRLFGTLTFATSMPDWFADSTGHTTKTFKGSWYTEKDTMSVFELP